MPARRKQTTNNAAPLVRVWADIHFHEWQDFARIEPAESEWAGLNSRLADQLKTVLSAPPPASSKVPCVIAGDIIHKRGVITPAVGWAVSSWLMKLREQHERVIIFPGNHDYPLKAGADWVHALSPFIPFGLGGISIVDVPTVLELEDDALFYIVPWMPDIEDWREAVDTMAREAATRNSLSILTTHIAVQGGVMANGHSFTGRGATSDDLHSDVFDAVLLGDFHKRQKLANNAWYVGAPMQHHWGDAGDSKRGFAEVQRESDNSLRITFNDLRSPKFIETRNMREADAERTVGNYVRVTSSDSGVLNEAQETGFAVVRELPPAPETRIELRPGSRPKDVLFAYFEQEHYQGELDADELLKLASSILDDTADNNELERGAMQIVSVSAVNFLSYDRLEIDLDNKGVVLLDGANEDDPDADSNGAGKSAVIEAIVAALYGKTLRDVPVGEWIKKGKRNGYVSICVITPRGNLKICRNRNHSDMPPGISVTLDEQRIDSTASNFQSQLDAILGMNFTTFVQVAVFGQEVPRVFAKESDAGRKELLENLCGGEQFDTPARHTKELLDTIKAQSSGYMARLVELQNTITQLERDVETLRVGAEGFETGKAFRVNEAEQREQEIIRQLENNRAALLEKREHLERMRESESTLAEVQQRGEEVLQREAELRRPLDAALTAHARAENNQSRAETAFNNAEQAVRTGNEAVCPTCSRSYEINTQHVETARQELNEANEQLQRTQNELQTLQDQMNAMVEERAAARAGIDQWHEARRSGATLQADVFHHEENAEQLQRRQVEAQARLQAARDENNHFISALNEKRQQLETAREDVIRVEQNKASADGVIPYLEECVRMFGNQGLKTFLFDSLAPQITNEANRALSILSGGALSVAVTTERRGRSEKIMLEVGNAHGALSFRGNSGGQKSKINLALCWAIASLAEGRVNLLFIDEAFDNLDSTAGLRVCDLLEARQRETGTIIVTSHRSEFREAFPVVWTARRSNGNSVLEAL